ncbi:hypothetical protein B0H34DRAFT_797918 [Crassisporium funariophilum]|nr:hypothetical protein B0H34DRAFT_797918 [Crassisporium funariophilum]
MAADLANGRTYGQAIPDQMERILNYFDAHLELISDVRELYGARVALEKEYAGKLQLLARKASEKKAKMESRFIIGDEPSKSWDSSTLRRSTLNNAFEEIMGSMANSAKDHVNLADKLSSEVVEVLRTVGKKNEEAKQKEVQFFQKLLSERDRVYGERLKSKQQYDEECAEVESFRQKQAGDDWHADRVARQAEQQRNEMLNSKNIYLISTAIANRAKAKFYQEDLPSLENELQTLQGRLVNRLTKVLLQAHTLERAHLDSLTTYIVGVEGQLDQVNAVEDQDIFIEYNLRTFTAPGDWTFDACSIHYDTDKMSVEPEPKIFIQNKLRRCRAKLQELSPLMDSKRIELDQLLSQVLSTDQSVGDVDELTDRYLETGHQLVFYATSESVLNTEMDTIMGAIGDDEGASRPHLFKSSSFSIPTQCAYCMFLESSIWGFNKQGKTCTLCGLSVHSKCELKVAANCEQSEERQSMVVRKSTNKTGLPASGPPIVPSASSFIQPAATEDLSQEGALGARVLFDFKPTSEFELAVYDGMRVRVLEADDGSGWVKVADDDGNSGLVPASYVDILNSGAVDEEEGRQGVSCQVRAIYPYDAQSTDELSLREGETLELSAGPKGGKNYGNGWWEGFNAQGKKGIFPSNYVRQNQAVMCA